MSGCIFAEGWNAVRCAEYADRVKIVGMIERREETKNNELYDALTETIAHQCGNGETCPHIAKYERMLREQTAKELVV